MSFLNNIKTSANNLSEGIRAFDFNSLLSVENLLRNIPYFLFLVLIAMIYIGNTHVTERTVRKIDRLKSDMKEIRWEYMSTKADLMYKSKQTEVAKAVEPLGLKELINPPRKIIVYND